MQNVNDDLKSMDLRLLRFMRSLLQTQNVTRTAEILGISQPSASRILARVRDLTGDPVLIRSSDGFQLTDHALSLKQPLNDALLAIEQVFQREVFDPLTSRYRFRIAGTDYAVACYVAPMMARMETSAPNIQIDVSPFVPGSFDLLAENEIDLIFCADMKVAGDIISRKISEDHYSLIVRRGHPLTRQENRVFTPRDIAPFRQIDFKYPTLSQLKNDEVMRAPKTETDAVLLSPYFLAMPYLVAMTDAVAAVPNRLGAVLAQVSQLQTLAFDPGQTFGYHLMWHERARFNPAVAWFVEEASKTAASPEHPEKFLQP